MRWFTATPLLLSSIFSVFSRLVCKGPFADIQWQWCSGSLTRALWALGEPHPMCSGSLRSSRRGAAPWGRRARSHSDPTSSRTESSPRKPQPRGTWARQAEQGCWQYQVVPEVQSPSEKFASASQTQRPPKKSIQQVRNSKCWCGGSSSTAQAGNGGSAWAETGLLDHSKGLRMVPGEASQGH